jgi:hypothetical protein
MAKTYGMVSVGEGGKPVSFLTKECWRFISLGCEDGKTIRPLVLQIPSNHTEDEFLICTGEKLSRLQLTDW